jgi:hypothetical protein
VLPEFLIHVQLEWSAPPEDAALRPGCTASGEPLPAPPGMLPVASRRNCPPVLHIASTSVGRGEGGLESEASRRSRPLRPPLGSQLPEEEEGQEGEEGSAGCFLSSAVSASYFAPSSMSLQAALGGRFSCTCIYDDPYMTLLHVNLFHIYDLNNRVLRLPFV